MELTSSARTEVLRTIRNIWGGNDFHLMALRLGEEPAAARVAAEAALLPADPAHRRAHRPGPGRRRPGKGPKRARELTRAVGVHYYDPSTGEPGFYRQLLTELHHTRLDPRTRLPRTRKQSSALPDDCDSTSDFNPFARSRLRFAHRAPGSITGDHGDA
ncbi:hypothetical protein AB0E10_44435 [Streptomyces sp. NPDC048045]|uniref:hypothetical protein n=1 Tax=Streptomyces sp. NPDC048045 TaxID=3154710 RepID=UPI003423462A